MKNKNKNADKPDRYKSKKEVLNNQDYVLVLIYVQSNTIMKKIRQT